MDKSENKVSKGREIEAKNQLQYLLNVLYGPDMICEKGFPWLKAPKPEDCDDTLRRVIDALSAKDTHSLISKETFLRCDFVSETHRLIIEYDERQHFSEARGRALAAYTDIPVSFDRDRWIQACKETTAKSSRPGRDIVRAYYDSVRDILVYRHRQEGFCLIRIMHGQIDFSACDANERLKKLIDEGIERYKASIRKDQTHE